MRKAERNAEFTGNFLSFRLPNSEFRLVIHSGATVTNSNATASNCSSPIVFRSSA